ncbi:alpha/beta-type small acid-soluble spore protein [Calorimonas adulescens]|uniref:Alpha/beta-type small acid-soluble spore protein n=1 Tax=Calorimonas adulescens TaxID=2606906 RepID=A0A5D8Q8U7_9THEO|nr:alpha/beta-type small acid-soluble spore protein [Calorimonas adulescens]TZE80912.1 alpha/beta-type small acid-soluble spore protein [Calorimonas adulescens]
MSNWRKIYPKSEDELDDLRDEVAEELDLDDDIEERGWENMTTREVGKIGGHMVKKMIRYAEKQMDRKSNITDGNQDSEKKNKNEI